jgi:hypothetical protein
MTTSASCLAGDRTVAPALIDALRTAGRRGVDVSAAYRQLPHPVGTASGAVGTARRLRQRHGADHLHAAVNAIPAEIAHAIRSGHERARASHGHAHAPAPAPAERSASPAYRP